jgi:hypothetical protein
VLIRTTATLGSTEKRPVIPSETGAQGAFGHWRSQTLSYDFWMEKVWSSGPLLGTWVFVGFSGSWL